MVPPLVRVGGGFDVGGEDVLKDEHSNRDERDQERCAATQETSLPLQQLHAIPELLQFLHPRLVSNWGQFFLSPPWPLPASRFPRSFGSLPCRLVRWIP